MKPQTMGHAMAVGMFGQPNAKRERLENHLDQAVAEGKTTPASEARKQALQEAVWFNPKTLQLSIDCLNEAIDRMLVAREVGVGITSLYEELGAIRELMRDARGPLVARMGQGSKNLETSAIG